MASCTSSKPDEIWGGLHAEFDKLFVGPLQHLHGIFVDRDRVEEPTLSIVDLMRGEHLAALAEAFCRAHGETPRIAIYSIWSKWYFGAVLPTLICSGILLGRLPPFRLSEIRLALDADYKIKRVAVPNGKSLEVSAGQDARFKPLIEGNIEPFIEMFHGHTGVSRRVLWSNAGTLFEGVVRHLEKVEGRAPGIDEGLALLSTRVFPDGARNRLYEPVTYPMVGGERVRRRRVCCLRYQLPDRVLCCACPLHETERRGTSSPLRSSQGTGP